MNIFISGISGTGMGPLALMAKAAGMTVYGSDLRRGAIDAELEKAGIERSIGVQDGEFLREKLDEGIDWFVYTSALPEDSAELKMARAAGAKCSKRDELTAFLVQELNLKMVAVAGTHGKTTTTAMIVFAALKLGLPVAYIVGSTLGFAPSGSYVAGSEFFVYEADEYDRNFLKYHPWLAVIPAVSYDHPDIYPTRQDYLAAFAQFEAQSEQVIKTGIAPAEFELAGEKRRLDAGLAAAAVLKMAEAAQKVVSLPEIIEILNNFPGVGRRFEKLSDGLYTDYAHHPEEIAATINIAQEEARRCHKKGVVAIYEPHQNTRQHEVRTEYADAFLEADRVLWLPTYLTREDPKLSVLEPKDLIAELINKEVASEARLDAELIARISKWIKEGYLVLLMTAGPADEWLRKHLVALR